MICPPSLIRRFTGLALLAAVLGSAAPAAAADLRISLPLLPPLIESRTKGPLAQLAQAIAREWKEGKVIILGPSPFEQSVDNVTSGKADVHFPLIASPARDDDELPYQYSSFALNDVPFALYTRKDNPRIDPRQLTITTLSKLRIETDRAHTALFYFQVGGAESVEAGLKHVAAGQSDGFLFSIVATEPVRRRLKLDSLVGHPYRRFKSMMIISRDGARSSEEIDDKLGLIIDRLKDSGEYQKIMAPLLNPAAITELAKQ